MIGVAIMFKYGPPQPSLETGVSMGLEDGNTLEDGRTVAQYNQDQERLRARHSVLWKVGLALVFVGFAVQLWGALID